MSNKTNNIIMTVMFAVLIVGLGAVGFILPDKVYSESERRELETMPELNAESIDSGEFFTDLDSYMLDHFPMRDSFRTLKAVSEYYAFFKADNNDIYIVDGSVSKMEYPMNEGSAADTSEKFAEILDILFPDSANAYYSVIYDKNYFLADQSGRLSIDYDAFLEELHSSADPRIEYVEIGDLLGIGDFYNTDLHWKQEAIIDIADRLLEGMGADVPNRDYEHNTLQPFYGGYFGQAALPLAPDELVYLTNDVLSGCTVHNPVTGESFGLYLPELFSSPDPYDVYLSGAESLLVIENPADTSGRELYIVRDSFSSSLAPLLIESYSRIVLVDIRYISATMAAEYVTPAEDCDVLFLLNTMIMNRSYTFAKNPTA